MEARPKPKETYDVVVVGGGIYGAAHAWEAASAGLATLLIEAKDYCSRTSANSLKTIHGGIRYLQTLDLGKVREAKREQSILFRIAPHLIRPLPCMMPTDWSIGRNPLSVWGGFTLYKWIPTGVDGQNLGRKYRIIGPASFKQKNPWFTGGRPSGAAVWWDAQVFDSERLVIDYLVSAREAGADIFNYREADSLHVDNGRVAGLSVRDNLSNESYRVEAKSIVDTTASWAAAALQRAGYSAGRTHGRVRAVNLVFDKGNINYALGIRSRPEPGGGSGRLLFAAPWRSRTIVGTWYFPWRSDIAGDQITKKEFEYCIEDVRSSYAGFDVDASNVALVHVGVLPTKAEASGDNSYETLLERPVVEEYGGGDGPKGLWDVLGVKYTTARAVAEKTIGGILRTMGRAVESKTRTQSLHGGTIGDRGAYLNEMVEFFGDRYGTSIVRRLVDEYGATAEVILQYAQKDQGLASIVPGTETVLKAEIMYAVSEEQALNVGDVLIRRTGIGAVGMPATSTINWCAEFMADQLGWDPEEKEKSIAELKAYYDRISDS